MNSCDISNWIQSGLPFYSEGKVKIKKVEMDHLLIYDITSDFA